MRSHLTYFVEAEDAAPQQNRETFALCSVHRNYGRWALQYFLRDHDLTFYTNVAADITLFQERHRI